MTTPIPHEESRITALDVNSQGHIYGGTSGCQSHLFAAAYHGITGIVLDVGAIPGATSTVAVCCGDSRVIAFLNVSGRGHAVAMPNINLAENFIQEWFLERQVLTDLGVCVSGEAMVHAVCAPSRETIVGVSAHHLFTMDVKSGKVTVVAEIPAAAFLAVGRDSVFGVDDGARLWRFDLASGKLERAAVQLPQGDWSGPRQWACDSHTGLLYTADADGRLYSFDGKKDFRYVGKTHLTPVGPMAVTADGRLFGFCGNEMANLFCYDTDSASVSKLGVAVSVIEQRRYGYQFGAAVAGRDGEIVFGEDDNSGHLWIYFPKVLSR
jgi:outer membrane protein assembly factor BamB